MAVVLAELGITGIDIGATALLTITVLMIFTARLVPKRYYDEALSRVAEVTEEKDNWKKVAHDLLAQNTLLLSMTTLRAIRASVEGQEAEDL
jgi:hypothetical protein